MPVLMPAGTPAQRAAAVEAARALLDAGQCVAVPTDTVYGLAADAANVEAVAQLFEMKDRPADRSIALLVADLPAAEELVRLSPQARRIAEQFWPGPLTIVAPRSPGAPRHLGTAATLGVRLPDDDMVRALAAGRPLAVTSANRHGGATPPTAKEVADIFPSLDLVVDGGPRPGASSTVVDVSGDGPIVLRGGPVTRQEILAVAAQARP